MFGSLLGNTTVYDILARLVVLFTAMPIHECAHGFAAYKLGDDTAHRQGRLTLNQFVHLDLVGSILILLTGFGWAKPVQVNTRNFAHPRRDMAISSFAGPLSNIILAFVAMVIFKLFYLTGIARGGNIGPIMLVHYIIIINLYLAVFNLLPIPPLDGFKVFGSLLPDKIYFLLIENERYISFILFFLIFSRILSTPISFIANLIYSFFDIITRFIA